MGLFSKEACILCGKEVGAFSRSKLASGEYICNDCQKKTHEFARVDYLTLDELNALIAEVPEREAAFDLEAPGSSFSREMGSGHRLYYYSAASRTGEFAFKTPDTERFGHKCIFSFYQLGPYDNTTVFNFEAPKPLDPDKDYVTVEEKKSGDKVEGYYLCFDYNDKAIRKVRIDLRNMKKEDADHVARQINYTRRSILDSDVKEAIRKAKLQQQNLAQTASAALKAAVKGENVEAAITEGAERATDIEEGKIKKKGLFGWRR